MLFIIVLGQVSFFLYLSLCNIYMYLSRTIGQFLMSSPEFSQLDNNPDVVKSMFVSRWRHNHSF